jgi:hypothetical protein
MQAGEAKRNELKQQQQTNMPKRWPLINELRERFKQPAG